MKFSQEIMDIELGYKNIVKEICELKWQSLSANDLLKLIVIGEATAKEFAESLRIALNLYPNNIDLRSMAKGELETGNLIFQDYYQIADHSEFLSYIIKKFRINTSETDWHTHAYLQDCRSLSDEVRAMSVFSRECELPKIFERILSAKGWQEKHSLFYQPLPYFEYYLQRHIDLDTKKGGHRELTASLPKDDRLEKFYKIRKDLYTNTVKGLQ